MVRERRWKRTLNKTNATSTEKRETHVLVRAGRNRLKLEEAAIVVQRRALILVCPCESRASFDDSCVL